MEEVFKFNLLPKKTEEEIEKETKRDTYSVFYSFLPLFGVILWIALVLFNLLVIDGLRNRWEDTVKDKENQIEEEFLEVRQKHGELVHKTNIIQPLLSKDIDPEIVFLVADQVFPKGIENIAIVGYGRNDDGSFRLSITSDNFQRISQKARTMKNMSLISNLKYNEVKYDMETNKYVVEVNFNINVDEI